MWFGGLFWHVGAHFHTQRVPFTLEPTFPMFRVIKSSLEAFFLKDATKCPSNANNTQKDKLKKVIGTCWKRWFFVFYVEVNLV